MGESQEKTVFDELIFYFKKYNGWGNEKGIPIGYVSPKNNLKGIIHFLKAWTKRIDLKLNECEPFSKDFIRIMEYRYISFEEYLSLFSKSIDIKNFILHKAFEFYMLSNHQEREELIAGYSKSEEDFLLFLEKQNLLFKKFLNSKIIFRLDSEALSCHLHLVAKSGQGKSNFLKILIDQFALDPSKSRALFLIDPHGDLADEIFHLKSIFTEKERLVFIDPFFSDSMNLTINPFDVEKLNIDALDRYSQELSKTISSLLKKGTELSVQMEALLGPIISTLIGLKNSTLEDILILLSDVQSNRKNQIIDAGLKNPLPSHRRMFEHIWIDQSPPHSYKLTISSIYTKIQSLLNTHSFYKLTCGNNSRSTINLPQALDQNKIILCKLSKGRLGEEAAEALGKLLLAIVYHNAIGRSIFSKESRNEVFVIVDEFQNYALRSIGTMLNETRKYGYSIILSHQSTSQISESFILESVFANANLKIVGTSNIKTLKSMGHEMNLDLKLLKRLPAFHFYLYDQSPKKEDLTFTPLCFKPLNYLLDKSKEVYIDIDSECALKKEQLEKYYRRNKLNEKDGEIHETNSEKFGQGQMPKFDL